VNSIVSRVKTPGADDYKEKLTTLATDTSLWMDVEKAVSFSL
jgi:hypothetical protein